MHFNHYRLCIFGQFIDSDGHVYNTPCTPFSHWKDLNEEVDSHRTVARWMFCTVYQLTSTCPSLENNHRTILKIAKNHFPYMCVNNKNVVHMRVLEILTCEKSAEQASLSGWKHLLSLPALYLQRGNHVYPFCPPLWVISRLSNHIPGICLHKYRRPIRYRWACLPLRFCPLAPAIHFSRNFAPLLLTLLSLLRQWCVATALLRFCCPFSFFLLDWRQQ